MGSYAHTAILARRCIHAAATGYSGGATAYVLRHIGSSDIGKVVGLAVAIHICTQAAILSEPAQMVDRHGV